MFESVGGGVGGSASVCGIAAARVALTLWALWALWGLCMSGVHGSVSMTTSAYVCIHTCLYLDVRAGDWYQI